MELNYIKFQDIDCVYYRKDNAMILIPKDEKKNFNFLDVINKKNFIVEFATTIYSKSYAFVKNISITGDRAIRFNILYYVLSIPNENFNEIQLTGDEIDMIFNPASYFFPKAEEFKRNPVDLIYGKHIGKEYNIKYKGENISVVLSYGDIFESGIASDLKLHAKLTVLFEETNSIEKVHELVIVVIKFIQLVSHHLNTNFKPIQIFGKINGRKQKVGTYHNEPYEMKNINAFPVIQYDFFKPYIAEFLQFVANNNNINLNFYPKDFNDSYSYDIERFLAIFSAFENECRENPEIYENIVDNSPSLIKEDLLEVINNMGDNDYICNDDKNFLSLAKGRIAQLGTQFGQKKKIVNAYKQNNNIFKESMNSIFPRGFKIEKVANDLTELRNKIVHSNFHTVFDREEINLIRFLEILTYIMLLKRIGIEDKGIEVLIGVVFGCNTKYMHI